MIHQPVMPSALHMESAFLPQQDAYCWQ